MTPQGTPCVDQNFDSYSVEYTFADGAKLIADGRCIAGCDQILLQLRARHQRRGDRLQGRRLRAALEHLQGPMPERSKMTWESKVTPDQNNPYPNEWNDLVDAIRNDKPYNEVERGVQASLVSSLGRKAAHTGQ